MAYYNRWWLSPAGELIEVKAQNHGSDITQDPEKFGITKEDVDSAYERSGEKRGQEGLAREELIKKVMARGWLRVRYDDNNGLYVETGNLDRYKDVVADAIHTLRETGRVKAFDPVVVVDWRTDKTYHGENPASVIRQIYANRKASLRLLKVVPSK